MSKKPKKTTKTARFEFRTTPEFLARIDALRQGKSRAAVIEKLCDYALRIPSPPAPRLPQF